MSLTRKSTPLMSLTRSAKRMRYSAITPTKARENDPDSLVGTGSAMSKSRALRVYRRREAIITPACRPHIVGAPTLASQHLHAYHSLREP